MSSYAMNIIRTMLAVACLFLVLTITRPTLPSETRVWFELALSGLLGLALGDTALYAALKKMGAQATSALQTLSPPMTALMAFVFLQEKMTWIEVVGIVITVSAVAGIILSKGSEERRAKGWFVGVIFALLAAFFNSIGIVLSRDVMANVDPFLGSAMRMFPAMLFMLALGKIAYPYQRAHFWPSNKKQFFMLCLATFLGAFIGVTLMMVGIKYAKAGIAATLSVTYPIFVVPIACLLLKETVKKSVIIYTIIAVCGVILLMLSK